MHYRSKPLSQVTSAPPQSIYSPSRCRHTPSLPLTPCRIEVSIPFPMINILYHSDLIPWEPKPSIICQPFHGTRCYRALIIKAILYDAFPFKQPCAQPLHLEKQYNFFSNPFYTFLLSKIYIFLVQTK